MAFSDLLELSGLARVAAVDIVESVLWQTEETEFAGTCCNRPGPLPLAVGFDAIRSMPRIRLGRGSAFCGSSGLSLGVAF
jgi:hypothetical protein